MDMHSAMLHPAVQVEDRYRHVRMYIREEYAEQLEAMVLALQSEHHADRLRYLQDRERYFDISKWATECPDGVEADAEVRRVMQERAMEQYPHRLLSEKFMCWRKDMAGKRGDQRRQRPTTYLTGDVVSSLLDAL